MDNGADSFPEDVVELITYMLDADGPPTRPVPVPGRGYLPQMWLLGSSTFSAQLAGLLGLAFSFAYHFSPGPPRPGPRAVPVDIPTVDPLDRPRVMVAVSVICAPTTRRPVWLSGPSALSILQLRTGRLGPLPTPEDAAAYPFTAEERAVVEGVTATHLIGDPATVHDGLVALQHRTEADEIMISTRAHSFEARAASLSLVAERWPMDHHQESDATPAA